MTYSTAAAVCIITHHFLFAAFENVYCPKQTFFQMVLENV